MTQVSFIIVNYNTPELTLQCIRSIQEQTVDVSYEIIVMDNASTDQSRYVLSGLEGVCVYFNEKNEGFGRANNKGVALAGGDYLFFINSDAYLLNDAASILYRFMEQEANHPVGVCGGDLFDAQGNRQVAFGNFPSLLQVIGDVGFRRFFPVYYQKRLALAKRNEKEENYRVPYLSGADWFMSRQLFLQTGGFDPDFFLYFEETEYAYRLKQRGYPSVLVPTAKLVHLEGQSNRGKEVFNPGRYSLFEKSRQLFFRKRRGYWQAYLVKVLLSAQAAALALIKNDRTFWQKAQLVWKVK